jgi:hypothetical protein
MGMKKEAAMPFDIREQLAEIEAELARQNRQWEGARRALASRGSAPVTVPNEFLEGLEAISQVRTERQRGIRV